MKIYLVSFKPIYKNIIYLEILSLIEIIISFLPTQNCSFFLYQLDLSFLSHIQIHYSSKSSDRWYIFYLIFIAGIKSQSEYCKVKFLLNSLFFLNSIENFKLLMRRQKDIWKTVLFRNMTVTTTTYYSILYVVYNIPYIIYKTTYWLIQKSQNWKRVLGSWN